MVKVKQVSDYSLRVGNKIVEIDSNGTCTAHTELTTKETEALQSWLLEHSETV